MFFKMLCRGYRKRKRFLLVSLNVDLKRYKYLGIFSAKSLRFILASSSSPSTFSCLRWIKIQKFTIKCGISGARIHFAMSILPSVFRKTCYIPSKTSVVDEGPPNGGSFLKTETNETEHRKLFHETWFMIFTSYWLKVMTLFNAYDLSV